MKAAHCNPFLSASLGFLSGLLICGILILIVFNAKFHEMNLESISSNNSVGIIESPRVSLCVEQEISSLKNKLDINFASYDDLDTLPGIGDVKAKSIISFRQKYGNFKNIDELLFVPGISEDIFQQICNSVSVIQ
jgi:competence protein ComEA